MKIKLIKPYYINPAGAVLDVSMPIAELLIGRNIAEQTVGVQHIAGGKKRGRPPKVKA